MVVSIHNNGSVWILAKDFKFYLDGEVYTVPKGFKTDFATLPVAAIPLLGLKFKFSKANVLHDYLYATGKFSRKQCDDIYYRALIKLGTNRYKAKLAYCAVRLLGEKHYLK